jgi:2-desacetyl-2-hydroxyethyl bacteriochlorophyllide A dehydrogenase
MRRAVVFLGVNEVGLLGMELPEPEQGEVRVRAEFTAVSPGTELRCLAGSQPNSLSFPFVPGYAMLGIVEAIGPDVDLAVGTRVFCRGTFKSSLNLQWGGHVSHGILKASDVFPVDDGANVRDVALAKMVAIASRGVTLAFGEGSLGEGSLGEGALSANRGNGQKVAVVGLGPIGLLSARLFSLAGADVLGVDVSPERLKIPQAAGLNTRLVDDSIYATVFKYFGQGADVVVDATGSPKVLPNSMAALRDLGWGDTLDHGPKLVIQGSYPGEFSLPYQEAFVKELTVLMPRDSRPADVRLALDLIGKGQIKVDDLVTWQGNPEDSPEAYRALQTDRSQLTAVFDWRG